MRKSARLMTGKVVAVTGGGRGIGRAIAEALAREGMKVAVGDIELSRAQAAAQEIGKSVIALPLDVTDAASFKEFLDAVENELGPLYGLINNAGIMITSPLVDEDDAVTRAQLEINLYGVTLGSKEAIRRMGPRRQGHIVNIASAAGRSGFPHAATYCATKFGVVGLSEALRPELRDLGISVTVVMPAFVNTKLATGLSNPTVRAVEVEEVAAEVLRALKFGVPEIYIPKSTGPLIRFANLLPARGRDLFGRLLKADRAFTTVDPKVREEYVSDAIQTASKSSKIHSTSSD